MSNEQINRTIRAAFGRVEVQAEEEPRQEYANPHGDANGGERQPRPEPRPRDMSEALRWMRRGRRW